MGRSPTAKEPLPRDAATKVAQHRLSVLELAKQAAFLEKLNPCFRERHVESPAPGELLSADTFFVGRLKGIGKVYLHAVVDTHGSYAFGLPRTSPSSRRPRSPCCTTTCCPSTATSTCR